jgi:uncharacterized RDD family membrane protein YckC
MTEPQDPFAAPSGEPTGAQPTPPPAYGMPITPAHGGEAPAYASLDARVRSALVDWFLPLVLAQALTYVSNSLGWLALFAALAWAIYNRYLEGTTGQSVGKKMVGTRLIRDRDGQHLGAGLAIVRMFVHIVDGLPCYLGYLWPLWDAKKQTFADKILGSVVVKA